MRRLATVRSLVRYTCMTSDSCLTCSICPVSWCHCNERLRTPRACPPLQLTRTTHPTVRLLGRSSELHRTDSREFDDLLSANVGIGAEYGYDELEPAIVLVSSHQQTFVGIQMRRLAPLTTQPVAASTTE